MIICSKAKLPRPVVEVRVPRRPGAVEGERELLVMLVFLAPKPQSLEHFSVKRTRIRKHHMESLMFNSTNMIRHGQEESQSALTSWVNVGKATEVFKAIALFREIGAVTYETASTPDQGPQNVQNLCCCHSNTFPVNGDRAGSC